MQRSVHPKIAAVSPSSGSMYNFSRLSRVSNCCHETLDRLAGQLIRIEALQLALWQILETAWVKGSL